jgi:hypothetical protein
MEDINHTLHLLSDYLQFCSTRTMCEQVRFPLRLLLLSFPFAVSLTWRCLPSQVISISFETLLQLKAFAFNFVLISEPENLIMMRHVLTVFDELFRRAPSSEVCDSHLALPIAAFLLVGHVLIFFSRFATCSPRCSLRTRSPSCPS